MATKFRSKIWDPFLIISQIVSMQFQFYSTLLLINYLTNRFLVLFDLTEENYSLDHIFNHKLVNFGNVSNAFLCINLVLNSFLSSLFEWKLINRSKQCLDFTVTVYVYHIVISWFYMGSFPSTFLYWFIIVLCATITTVLSEYLCMQTALKEIPLSFAPKTNL